MTAKVWKVKFYMKYLFRCKFVQTDPISDDLVQLRNVQVLQGITSSPVRTYLTDETAWDIVEACYNVLLQQGKKILNLHY